MEAPTVTYPVVTKEEYPYGLRCAHCNRLLPYGTPYAEQVLSPGNLESESEDFWDQVEAASTVLIICVYCGLED